MTDRDDDADSPPPSGELPSGSVEDPGDDAQAPQDDAEAPDGQDDEPEDVDDGTPRVTLEELSAFLALPATSTRAAGIVGAKVKPQDVEDFVSQAVAEALAAKVLPCSGRVQAWFDSICRRVVAGHYRKRARRKKYEGAMPEARPIRDEAGEPVDDPGDAVVDLDPSYRPDEDDFRAEGLLFDRWMRDAVADDPQDRETYAIMEEWADADEEHTKTYAQLAKEHGLTEVKLYKRIQRLKEKYLARYKRWRNGFFALLLFGASIVALVAWLVYRAVSPRPPMHEPIAPEPVPSASASPSATPAPLPPLEERKNIADPPRSPLK
jgi:DNA-directed RNA polymerase specialized sigma24 family protein